MNIGLRYFDPLTIHYIVFVPHPSEKGVPWETTGLESISSILPFVPHNYMHLFHPFEYSSLLFCSYGTGFKLSFVHSYESFTETVAARSSKINVLFMIEQNDKIVADAIRSTDLIFFICNRNIHENTDYPYLFDSFYILSQKLLSIRKEIVSWYSREISPNMPIDGTFERVLLEDNVDFYDFKPSFSLTAYINQYLGKMWEKPLEQKNVKDHTKRAALLLTLLAQCDKVSLIGATRLKRKNISAHPIFLLSPFFDTTHRKDFQDFDKDLYSLLGTEQNFAYEHILQDDIKEKAEKFPEKATVAHLLKMHKITEMEIGAYLHSVLSLSPLLRLPEKGKSFTSILAKYKNGQSPSMKKNFTTLQQFGRSISKEIFFLA